MRSGPCHDEVRLPGGAPAWSFGPPAGARGPGHGVLLLPITAGDYEVERHLAMWLAHRGFTCMLVGRRAEWLAPGRMPTEIATQAMAALDDAREGIGWLLGPGQADPARVGLVGISLGAMLGAAVAGTDPRVHRSVLIIGGGDIVDVLLTANDAFVRDWRDSVAARLPDGMSGLGRELHAALDPLDLPGKTAGIDPSTALMIFAAFDRVVLPRHGRRLWEAAGRPRRIILPAGHYSTALFLPLIRRWIAAWLRR